MSAEPAPALLEPFPLGPMPAGRAMVTVDERIVDAPADLMFALARDVERWPDHLPHYRWVRFHERSRDGGGLVEMSAYRPFGPVRWPTWWLSRMTVDQDNFAVRFRHVRGITTGMDVSWEVKAGNNGAHVRIVHAWDGPPWPAIGVLAATFLIGPVFIHGIASRTLAGLAARAERLSSGGSEPRDRVAGMADGGGGG